MLNRVLMQVLVCLRQYQRGQDKGAEFAYGRRAEDIAAKITVAGRGSRRIGMSMPNAVVGSTIPTSKGARTSPTI